MLNQITGCLTDQKVWFPDFRSFRETFWWKFSKIWSFWKVNFDLNEEARGERPHSMPITVSSNHHYQLQLQLNTKPDVSTDTFWNTRIVSHNNKLTNSAQNFQEILQISRRLPGFPGVLDTLNYNTLTNCNTRFNNSVHGNFNDLK